MDMELPKLSLERKLLSFMYSASVGGCELVYGAVYDNNGKLLTDTARFCFGIPDDLDLSLERELSPVLRLSGKSLFLTAAKGIVVYKFECIIDETTYSGTDEIYRRRGFKLQDV